MAGRQPAPSQGEGSSRLESSFGLDHFLRRPLDQSSDQESAPATAASLPSPSNSIAALVSNYDDLSPNPGANPWQYLSTSDPSSPTSQREYYNQPTHNSSLFPSSHFQRDLVAEYPWMQDVLEQQRAANSQAHLNQTIGDSRSSDVDWQKLSRGAHYPAAPAPSSRENSIRRPRREQVIDNSAGDRSSEAPDESQTEALLNEEAATWYHNGSYLACGEGLSENFARLDSSGTHSSDSASAAVPHVDVTRWERPGMPSSQFAESEAREMDAGALPRQYRAPPPMGADAGAPSGSTQSPNLSSETDGEDDDDDDDDTRSIDPLGSVGGDGDCNGKRKTPEVSGEEGDDSARVSSEAELKRTSSSGARKRSSVNTNVKLPREPRYAIKTRTDVDIMDDGFKWRKYGQKAVKNSPHPRNYYRCTTPHCPVRKRVERCDEDSGLVITTYEGKHTHPTPGFPRPGANSSAGGYFGAERPRPGGGSFQNPAGLGPRRGSFPPLPHEFSTLAALHRMRALRSLQTLAQHQIGQLPPGTRFQRDSLLHFLGLQDAAFGAGTSSSVKQEPFPFDFMSPSSSSHGFPFPGRHFPSPGSFLERMLAQQMMRPARGAGPPPLHQLRQTQSDMDNNFPDFPPPATDGDLVRRVLEAEEQELSGGGDGANSNIDHDIANVDSSTFNYGGAAASPPPVSPQNFASQVQSSLRSRAEQLERQRSLQRPPSCSPRAAASLRRSKAAGGSSDNLVAAGSTSQRRQQQPDPREPGDHIPLLNGLLQEMVDQSGDR